MPDNISMEEFLSLTPAVEEEKENKENTISEEEFISLGKTYDSPVDAKVSEDGSLKSTENLSQEERQKLSDEAYSIKERRTASGDVVKGSMGAVYAKQITNIIKSLVTDKKEREEIVEGFGNIVDEKVNNVYNVFRKTGPAEISRIYKNIAFNDLYDKEELDYLKTQDPNASYEDPSGDPTGFKTNADRIKYLEGYKETSAAKQEEKINKFITEKYKEVEVYNKYLRKDTGEGIVKGVKQGDASDVVLGVFNAGASMAETVVPAMITGGWSLPFQITAPMLMDYNQQKAERIYGKDDPNAVAKLLENKEDEIAIPAALGLVATSLEYVGYKGITNYMLGKSAKGTVAKLLLTGNREGLTELGQSGIDEVNSALAQGKEGLDIGKAFIDGVFSEKGLESYLQGFIGGAGMSAGGKAINRALRSDNASVKEFNSLINNYAEFTLARNKTTNKKHKEILDLQVKKIEKKITDFVKNKRKIASILNKDQQASLIDLMNQKDQNDSEIQNLQKSLQDNQITKKDAGYILRSLNNENKKIAEEVELINESAKQQLLVTGLEATKEEGETVGLKQEVFETKEQYAALFGKKGSKKYNEALKADGHISDDGSTYYVNMDTARETGAIGVGSHELLHGIIGKSFSKLKPEAQRKLNENFLNLLSKRDKETVLNRLAGAYGVTGDKVFTTEELYTAFSDEIIDGGVKFNEGVFGKVANVFEDILRQLSSAGYFAEESFLYRKEFGNARQAYNFVKDYSLTIKKTGKITERAKEFAKVDPGSEGNLASKTITDAVDKLGKVDKDGNNLTEKGTGNFYYQAEADDVVKEIKEKGYLDNLIAARYKADKVPKNFVSDVITALTPDIKSFKPEENNSLFGYLQGRITFRAGDVYNKIYKQKEEDKGSRDVGETTKEGDVKIQVAAETTSEMKQLEEKDMSIQAQIKEKADKQKTKQQAESKFRKILGLETGGVLYMKVLDAARKSLLRAYSTKDTVRQIQRNLRDQANTYLFKDVKNLLGTNKYEANLKQYREIIMESLFVSDLVQMERETPQDDRIFTKFVKKLTTKQEVEDAVNQNLLPPSAINAYNKDKSVNLYQKGNPTEKQFLSYFMIPAINPITGLRSGKKGTRKDTLAKNIAGALTYDATLQVAQEPEIVEKRQELADINNTEILKDDLQVLAASINRNPNIKFAKNKTTYNQKIIKVKSGKVYVDFTQAQNVVNDIFNNNSKVNFYRNLTDAEANKYGGKFIVEAIIDQYDSRGIERIDNKTIVKFIKQRKRRKDKVSTVYEQFFIELADAAIKQTKADITINKYVREGGVPDVHFQFEGSSIGLEIKMDSARGVSYTWKFDDTSTNPNPIDKSATKKLIDKIKNTSKDNIFSNIDFLKGVTPKELSKLKTYKHMFNHSVKVTGKYLEYHYTSKKMPEYFINIGDAGLFYMLGKQGDVNNAEVLRIAKELNIPRLSGSFDLISRMSIGSARKNGSKATSIRIEPRIDSRSTENFNEKSSVNLSNKNDMNNFVKELNSSLIKVSKNKNSKTIGSAIKQSRSNNNPTKGITVLDFDDTLATTKSLVKFTRPDGTTGTLNAEQYASTYENLLDQGYTFDFSEFNKVVKGKLAPLFQKALKLQSKFGPKNMFVLTARPPAAQKAIFDFLKANGLNIPIGNITGLGNSTAEAKALWMADKVGEGFNDFYFADDALQNVQAVDDILSQLGVKRKVQQAKVKFSKSLGKDLAKNKNYTKFRNSLKGSVLYHGGTASLSDNKAVWFIASDIDGAELYADRRDGKVYSVNSNNLNDAIIIPDVSDLIGLDKVIKNKYKSIAKKVLDKYGQVNIKKVLETDVASEVVSDFMDYINNNFELLDGVYGPETLYDNDGKISKGIPVIVLGGNVSTKVSKVKFSKSIQTIPAVANMLDQFDVKSKVQQARVKFSKTMNNTFNDILQEVTGIETQKRFSAIKGRKRGDDKGKFRFFIPPSHEDFVGLLYNFMGEGRKGDAHRDFLEQALVRPLNRAYRELDTAKQAIANDYKKLNEQFPDVNDKLIKTTPDGDFTFQDAIRVYLWNKHGHKIPGLTETDQAKLTKLVESDPQLQAYAETLNVISKQEDYVAPGESWETANIRIDLVDATGRVGRAQYLSEFIENADLLFSEENLNKIEAGYGKDFREALEDMLHRIKTGVNRPKGQSGKPNRFLNWLNASVAGVMFFNTRSALLQQLSNVNYLNFADNNILAAGKAFANQKQYWKDFAFILNSDMLKQRRGGIGTDVNGAELVEAIKKARPDSLFDQVAIITGKLLRLGFLPTQMGDSIAIATGGAAFYRNRINTYLKQGLSQKEAEAKAFTDFQDITQSTQQSARPDMTSQQQASWIGKLVLNFLNTPSQYNRIIKKAGLDLKNRRITKPNTTQTQSDMSNLSRILYYGAAQNLIFYGLQTALFAVMFGSDDDDESEAFLKKKERVINGSIDTILRGSGIYGVAISTLKNMLIKFAEQREKGYNKDESAVIMEALNFSPVLGIRARKIVNAEKTLNYNAKVIDEMTTFDIDNPQWSAVTNYVEGTTTLPVNRLYQKTINVRNALDNQYTAFQRAMFFSGYTTWSLDLGDTEKMKKIKQKVKSKKKSKGFKDFKFK